MSYPYLFYTIDEPAFGEFKDKGSKFWLLFSLLIQKKSQQGIIFEIIPSRKEVVLAAFHTQGIFDKIEKEVTYV